LNLIQNQRWRIISYKKIRIGPCAIEILNRIEHKRLASFSKKVA
jgi:hypothetical protein